MSSDDKTLDFFAEPNTIPNLATAANVSREVAARRVKALVESGALVATGDKEVRQNRRGQRPVLYRIA